MPFAENQIPLPAKIGLTAFVTILVPIYFRAYGPTNFLWFCDAALILTCIGFWLESPLLISMCAVGILIPQMFWLIDIICVSTGIHFVGLTDYMYDKGLPLHTRLLSLFHGWLPFILLWALHRLGYDQRALPAWTALAWALILLCYWLTPASGASLPNPETPINVNNIYGFNNKIPQHWMNQNLYVFLWMIALALLAYLPTHLILQKVFRPATL